MGHTSVAWRYQDLWSGKSGYFPEFAFDQIPTFLICEKIDFDLSPGELDLMYDDTPKHLRHNLILDLTKGIFGYRSTSKDSFVGIPFIKNNPVAQVYIKSDSDNEHIKYFLTNLQILIPGATVYRVDMGIYLSKSFPKVEI